MRALQIQDTSRFQYRDTYPSAIQAKVHAPDQRLTALNRRWTFSQKLLRTGIITISKEVGPVKSGLSSVFISFAHTPASARSPPFSPVSCCAAILELLSGSNLRVYCFFFIPGLSSVKASSALNGNWRTDCCPVLLKVMSTRRFCASVTTFKFFRILSFCS